MSRLDPWYRARSAMVAALERDLLGTAEDDHLDEPPLDRFIVGILHPPSDIEIEDTAAPPEVETGTQVDADVDAGVSLSRMRAPSSMGLTFAVDPSTTAEVVVTVRADRYVPEVSADVVDEKPTEASAEVEAVDRVRSSRPRSWNRVEAVDRSWVFDTTVPDHHRVGVVDGLELRVVVRPADGADVSITAALVNTFRGEMPHGTDEFAWFRPVIRVEAVGGSFSERRGPARSTRGSEEASAELLYRDAVAVAVGHGCAVTWDAIPTRCLETTFLPRQEVRVSRAERAELRGRFGMATLASTDDRSALHDLVDAYDEWVSASGARVPALAEDIRGTAEDHLRTARDAAHRMRRGIEVLDADANAATAFRVMNEVMQEQRARQEMVRSGGETPPTAEQQWRPFQMAFILLNLEGLVDQKSDEREIADLLWFPTGGGKTEAYLGLIAFVLALRRLRGGKGGGGGVGVVMRYTLRLLTLQQFERAAGLVCALERWRSRALPDAEPVTIGLWVGRSGTPNTHEAASAALKCLRDGRPTGDHGNPRQLLSCPWCGATLSHAAYSLDRGVPRRLRVRCPGDRCEFRDGLPVLLVDEDVYDVRPSLLIGTVDKFAMMAWNPKVRRILGSDGAVEPPDLIVQDELHLISGPLGTLVGLYETAVDAAATGVARPKIVASTATIRRADEQVRAVFDRETRQFPPPGIDPGDSFFAVEAPAEELPARQYVGVLAPGTSHATLLVRSYAALLQAGKDLDATDEVKDAYWTLLGYFNSLRVLGAAFIQSIDDVPARIPVVARRGGSEAREINEPKELTSRVPSDEVPQRLKELSTSLGGDDCQDIVLATNMISVGVDVDRLGLMVVMGQPQTTSEYIQATSRVGRRHPGLVVTLYNSARTRDLSHYESFLPYHRALYRQVEATGATPFAPRAVDRGLHGVLVSLVRLLVPGASEDTAVAAVTDEAATESIREIVRERVRDVAPEEEQRVLDALDALVENWRDALDDERVQKYASWSAPMGALIVPAGGSPFGRQENQLDQFPVSEPAWPTLTSLRNVDATSSLYQTRRKHSGQ
ncbi:helicase domain protein [Cellulomonas gilvus ATCC 13127]|uniref:Helicase domain protein n=2 Tax=Cellulomonas gilvus TaxID=11 RepID=F8A6E9_CELGA|nr:helicase domain protein [Cellulomonas gilvus ATCC 13127]